VTANQGTLVVNVKQKRKSYYGPDQLRQQEHYRNAMLQPFVKTKMMVIIDGQITLIATTVVQEKRNLHANVVNLVYIMSKNVMHVFTKMIHHNARQHQL